MLLTRRELEDGMGESLAYERFGERCGLASYRRFASILTQNLKKGTVGIGRILAKESEDAFSQRKTMAQRLGEEAGTKLLPLFSTHLANDLPNMVRIPPDAPASPRL